MQSKHTHNNRLEEDENVREREGGREPPSCCGQRRRGVGIRQFEREDDPVKMRAKKLKSDDGNAERRNAEGGEGVKYAARALEKSRGRGREVEEGRPAFRREKKKAHRHN